MPENKKIVSFVNSMDLKNKLSLLTRKELEDKVKDSESFMSFINEQLENRLNDKESFMSSINEQLKDKDKEFFMSLINNHYIEPDPYWDSLDDVIENISFVEIYENININSYDDIRKLILKAFDENDIFVLEQDEDGSSVFFKFQEIEE